MSRRTRPIRALTAAVATALLVLVLPANAMARPEVERFHIQEDGVDPFLSDLCGTEVTVTVDAHITHYSFDDDPLRHRLKERGTTEYSSDHGTVIQFVRMSGVHEVVEVLEELEPEVFLSRVRTTSNGTLQLRKPEGGRPVALDAGTVTFDDTAVWDRANDELVALVERTVARVAGPHPLLDDPNFEILCAELTP